MGAWEEGDDTEIFYSRAGGVAAAPGAAFACSVSKADIVTD